MTLSTPETAVVLVGAGAATVVLAGLVKRWPVLGPIVALQAWFWLPNYFIMGARMGLFAVVLTAQLLAVLDDRHARDTQVALRRALAFATLMALLTAVLFGLAGLSHLVYRSDLSLEFVKYLAKLIGYGVFGTSLVLGLRTRSDVVVFIKAFLATALVASVLVGYYHFFTGKRVIESEYYLLYHQDKGPRFRLTTLAQHDPNYANLDLIPAALFALALAFGGKRRGRVTMAGVFLSAVFAVICTFSRGGMMALAFGVMCMIVGLAFAWSPRIVLVPAVCLGLLAGLFAFTGADWLMHQDNLARLHSSYNVETRLELGKAALADFLDHPLVGQGGIDIRTFLLEEVGLDYSIHNFYLTALFRHGLIGGGLVLGIMAWALYQLWEVCRAAARARDSLLWLCICQSMLASCMAYLLIVLTFSDTLGFYFCFFVAMAFVLPGVSASARPGQDPQVQSATEKTSST